MNFPLLFALVVAVFLLVISMIILLIWHSYRAPNIMGGLILMWSVIIIFLTIVAFHERSSAAAETAKPDSPADSSSTLDSPMKP